MDNTVCPINYGLQFTMYAFELVWISVQQPSYKITNSNNVNWLSTTQQMMVVPRHRLSTVGRRAFAVQGSMVWNSLPDDLHAQQDY